MSSEFEENPELNITPLVDIMLVLLAILMVTTPTIIYEEKISLPDGSKTTQISSKKDDLTIRIDKNKNITIDKHTMSFGEFPDNIVLLKNNFDINRPVFIRADKSLIYNDVMFILKVVKSAGFTKVALETNG